MYIVNIYNGDKVIPIHDSKQKLLSGKITKGINTIDSLQFSMLPSNAGFEHIFDYTTRVTVYNTFKNRYEFFGRVLYSDDEMDASGLITKEVICESYLGYLCDSQQDYVEERNWHVGELFQHIINTHNLIVESNKQFVLGEITVTDPNDNLYCGIQRENTWETLKKKFLDVLGGEISFRVVDDVIYIDYLVATGVKSSTDISLSKNMKSIVKEKDPSEIVTRLIPLGKKLSAVGDNGTMEETEYRLDIKSVNDGKKYIDDEEAIALYGVRVATVTWDDVTVATTLLKKGYEWLAANNKLRTGYTVSALDLSIIELDVDDFNVGNYHTIKNPLLNINETLRIIKKTVDICEPLKSTVEFGDSFEKLSEAMKRQADGLNVIVSNYVTNKRFEETNKRASTLISQTDQELRAEVTRLDQNNVALRTEMHQVADGIKIDIMAQIDSDGVDKVETGTGFTFNDEGLTVEELNKEIKTQITPDGMTVYKNEEEVLIANSDGVNATDLRARTYLIIGKTSRFNDFTKDGKARTGCFWIGG